MRNFKLLAVFAMLVSSTILESQSLYYPPLQGNNWDTISPQSLGWCEDRLQALTDWLDESDTKAFIILKDGKIAVEKYFGNFTADSLWYWASAGKTMTAVLTGIAVQEGKLKLSDKSSDYLGAGWTSLTLEQEQRITVFHQLTMTTGLDDEVPDHHCTEPSCLKYKAVPGTRWAYHNGPYTVLDGVLEKATGQKLNQFLYSRISQKTGITGQYFKNGYNNVLVSKPRSMARFGLLLLSGGRWNQTAILAEPFFKDMVNSSQQINPSYGYLCWLNGKDKSMVPGSQIVFNRPLFLNAPADMYSALGKNGQIINVVPSQNLVVVRMGNDTEGSPASLFYNDVLWSYINKLSCASSVSQQREESEFKLTWNHGGFLCYPDSIPAGSLILTDMQGKSSFPEMSANCADVSQLIPGLYIASYYSPDMAVRHSKVIIPDKN